MAGVLWIFFVGFILLWVKAIRQSDSRGIALWGALGGFTFVLAILASLFMAMNSAGSSSGADIQSASNVSSESLGMNHKAVTSVRLASKLAGGFSAGQSDLYRRGLAHIHNTHGRIGSYTIADVITAQQERDDMKAALARDAARRAQREEEAHFFHGKPDCLVLDDRTLHTESGDYTWYIEGRVVNRCDHDLGYVQVEFNFYDTSGNQVSSGLDNVNNLSAGQTWAFKKAVYETETSGTWRVVGLSGF